MDDPLLVRVLHGLANLYQQLDPIAKRQRLLLTELRNRRSIDEFHDQEWLSACIDSTVKYLGDVMVLHHRQCLPFGFETRDEFLESALARSIFDRNSPPNRNALLSHEHEPKPAFADFLQ